MTDNKSNIVELTSIRFFEILSHLSVNPDLSEKYKDIKQAKIWNINCAGNRGYGFNDVYLYIKINDLLMLTKRLEENTVKELTISGLDLVACYHGEKFEDHKDRSYKTYSGWTVKRLTVEGCTLGINFLYSVLRENAQFINSSANDSYSGKNLIEEINIKDCQTRGFADNNENTQVKEQQFKQLTMELLENNYRVRILNILYTNRFIGNETDRQIRRLLLRNTKGHALCLSAIYTILLAKRYRNSIFDGLPRDIIRLICQLLLESKGTKIWCLSELNNQ